MKDGTKKKSHILPKILLALVIVFLVLILGSYLVVHHYISKMNYVKDDEIVLQTIEEENNSNDEMFADVKEADQDEIDSANQELKNLEQTDIYSSSDVTNILLIGVDRRDASWYGNSDSMILVSINEKAKQVVMTSLMRDTYVSIPGVKNYKLNHAMAVGGPNLLVNTIEQNFRVKIDYYASVDFNAFTNVIDIFGTIPIQMTDAEISAFGSRLNQFEHSGNVYQIDSEFALSYARNRAIGRWDYERTERQRKIILSLVDQAKHCSLSQISQMADGVLPNITHNIPEPEMMKLIMGSISYMNYNIISDRIPYDGLYQSMNIEGQGMLVPDWPATIARLHDTIYLPAATE